MLHDRDDVSGTAYDAAVTVRIRDQRREHGRRCRAFLVGSNQSLDGCGSKQRDIPRQQQQRAPRIPEPRRDLEQRVTGSQLGLLHRKGKAWPPAQGLLQLVRLVTNHDHD